MYAYKQASKTIINQSVQKIFITAYSSIFLKEMCHYIKAQTNDLSAY